MSEPTLPPAPPETAPRSAYDAGVSAGKNRWLLLAVGGVTVLAGLIALAMPFVASLTATLFVGWLLLGSGIAGLITAFRRHEGSDIAAAFALAVLSVIAGVLILLQPVVGILALTTLIIAYFFATGALRLYYGTRLWGAGGGWMIAGGAVSVALSVLLWFGLPFNAAWIPGVLLGVDLVIWGAMLIALAIRVGAQADRFEHDARA